ncbi:MAG: 23S rRNA (pseudouridine(1915)-N(3))-methyltransferase RlmH [Anderseniella sp.]|nr:23S rRNA (pseudouridine(1915)-N(3))-methyltransferase RlmH [Anderseniella sp.]
MKLSIAAIGRMKSGPEADLLAIYLARARQQGRPAGITAITLADTAESRKDSAGARKADEARWLLGTAGPAACLVALDERGKTLSSEEFAGLIRQELDAGTSEIAFCLGGPDGHGQALRDAARHLVSFGRMTWPHKLARVMLAEQVYRSVTILVNHPYHRD